MLCVSENAPSASTGCADWALLASAMGLIEGGDVADDGLASRAAVPFDARLTLGNELSNEGEARAVLVFERPPVALEVELSADDERGDGGVDFFARHVVGEYHTALTARPSGCRP